jgi:hypothetical protein
MLEPISPERLNTEPVRPFRRDHHDRLSSRSPPTRRPSNREPGGRPRCHSVMVKSRRHRVTQLMLLTLVASSPVIHACKDNGSSTAERSSSTAPGASSSVAATDVTTGASASPPSDTVDGQSANASVPVGPATASLTFDGNIGLAGVATGEVTCSFPGLDGLGISMFAAAPDATFSYRVTITPDEVSIHVDSGAGSTFSERNFRGPGVLGFDATTGAQVDAQLTEAEHTQGVEPGQIGTITAVRGSIVCGDQTPGSSTITVTGESPQARYDASPLDPVWWSATSPTARSQ